MRNQSRIFFYFLIAAIFIGISFRFVNLGLKVYWTDEVYTSLRISGHISKQVLSNHISTIDELQFFQQVNPGHGWLDTISSLAKDSSHPPLYFALSQIWAEMFGSSIATIRLFSVFTSILMLPAMFWLALELFGSATAGIIAVALLSTSPLFVLYAQEARHYSLWILFTLLSNAAMLYAMRSPSWRSWLTYAIALVLGMFTHFFAILVTFSQILYVGFRERFRWTEKLKTYLGIVIPLLLILMPSLMFGFNFGQAARFTENPISWRVFFQRWLINLSLPIFDPQVIYNQPLFDTRGSDVLLTSNYWGLFLTFIYAGFVLGSLGFAIHQGNRSQRIFLTTSIGFTFGVLALPDLAIGGQRSTIARYLLACYPSLILACAYYLFAIIGKNKPILQNQSHQDKFILPIQNKLNFGELITITLLLTGLICSYVSLGAPTWWNKYKSYYNNHVSEIVNQAPNPLVISESRTNLISLSYLLKPSAVFWLAREPYPMPPLSDYSVFLYGDPIDFRKELLQNRSFDLEKLSGPGDFWKVVPREAETLSY